MIPEEILESMMKNRQVRVAVTKESHFLFFHFYFAHYVKYATADFQKEIFALTENEEIKNIFVCAFRGSGKSTIVTTSYPIWAILGKQQKKFVLILCQTRAQAKQHMMNLRGELENNALLKSDLGPFKEESDEWGSSSLVFSDYNARITVASTETSIRGLRHNQHRPDLIIGDDVEDLASVKTRETREKTHQWLTGEVIPIGDRNTRLVIVGNLLHEDSLLMKIKKDIAHHVLDGVFKEYPLINKNGDILWLGKYPSEMEIIDERKRTGSEISWQREYMLRIIIDEERVIRPEWIRRYGALPESNCNYAATGIDLAISEKETADYTAMVSAIICGSDEDFKIYILANPVNKRLSFPESLAYAKSISISLGGGIRSYLFIEEVGYQGALIQQLQMGGFPAEGVKVHGQDKRGRLALVSHLVQNGQVVFPEQGAERLIEQLIGFGVEKHDDLADAFAILLNKILEKETRGTFVFISGDKIFSKGKYSKIPGDENPTKTNHGIQTKIIKLKLPWKNKEELKKLEREADLEIMRRDLNPYSSSRDF